MLIPQVFLLFAEKQLTDLDALNSEATLSKFILETALDNLYLELLNELSIDNNIEKICQLRLEDKNLNSLWEKVKLKHYDNEVFKNFVSNEIESYQNKIEHSYDTFGHILQFELYLYKKKKSLIFD